MPGPADEAAAAATSWIENLTDPAAFKAGHAPNPVIVDEFPPFLWSGADAPENWLADFAEHSAATGIGGVHFDHAAPAQAQSNGDSAYVMVPVILRLQAGSKTLSAAGQIAFVMTRTESGWKIASWTIPLLSPNSTARWLLVPARKFVGRCAALAPLACGWVRGLPPAPLAHGLWVQAIAGGKGSAALLRRLELGSNTRRRAGAAVKNTSHKASSS